MKRIIKSLQLLTLGLVLFTKCGSNDEPTPPELNRLDISAVNDNKLDISINETDNLVAIGYDQNGNEIEIDNISWSANNENITIDQTGAISPTAVGRTIVTATVDGLESTISIIVWDSTLPAVEYYVSDAGNDGVPPFQILKYDQFGENPTSFIGNSDLAWPQDILFLEDQEVVLISNLSSNNIAKHDIATGRYISDFATGVQGPTRMKIGPDGLLYVLQWNGPGIVLRYQLDGTFVDEFTDSGVTRSIGMDWDAEGNLYVSSFNQATITKFDTDGKLIGKFIGNNLQGPTNIWFDQAGDLLVNDYAAGVVRKFDSQGIFKETIIQSLGKAEGIEFFENGDFLIGNGSRGAVQIFDRNAVPLGDFTRVGSGNLLTPNAVRARVVQK